MRLLSHAATGYRNLRQAAFAPAPGINVISGDNAQGKTNFLESIWLLTGAKSFLLSKDEDLLAQNREPDSDFARIESTFLRREGEQRITLLIGGKDSGRRGRSAAVNGVDYGRASAAAGIFAAVVFAPLHLELVSGPPEQRRRFLDAAICQIYPAYLAALRRYTRLLQQKNALLRTAAAQKQPPAEDVLDVLDKDLARWGAELIRYRRQYLAQFIPKAQRQYDQLAGGREALALLYQPAAETEEELFDKLLEIRGRERMAAHAIAGPHREDIAIEVQSRDARTFASQGQKRSVALCLKLAEGDMVAALTGEEPVMLLDDVLSELDEGRRARLLVRLYRLQTLLTCTDLNGFNGIIPACVLRVRDGKVSG